MIISRYKLLWILIIPAVIFTSCIQDMEKKEKGEDKEPELSLSYSLIGSHSAQLVCKITSEDRVFIKGYFEYAEDTSFTNSHKVLGLIIDNILSVTVNDLEEDKTYYYRADVSDSQDSFSSDISRLESVPLKISGDEFRIGWQGGDIEFEVITKDDVILTIKDTAWISEYVATKSFPKYSKILRIQANSTMYPRESEIIISSDDGFLKKTIKVLQKGTPVSFADPTIGNYIVSNYDKDKDGFIDIDELPEVRMIEIVNDGITSLKDLQWLPELERLVCTGRSPQSGNITEIDLSVNNKLKYIDVRNNKLSLLDISSCSNLKELYCCGNNLKSLELSSNEPLAILDCSDNLIESLDLTYNTSLEVLNCNSNKIASIIGNRSTGLKSLYCTDNCLDSLELKRNSGIERLYCGKNNLKSLYINNNEALRTLDCSENELTSLYIRRNLMLDTLICSTNPITALKVNYNAELTYLDCSNTTITKLNVKQNNNLKYLDCSGTGLTTLDISEVPSIESLFCNSNSLTVLFVSEGADIKGITRERSEDHISSNTVVRPHTGIASIVDPVFERYLLKYYDSDKDGILSLDEALSITSVKICTDSVTTLEGIASLVNLRYLSCEGSYDNFGNSNGKLEELDLSDNHQLEQLICSSNRIKSLNLSQLPELRTLWCFKNELTSMDLSRNLKISDLNCEYNQIENLDLSSNMELTSLDCSPMNNYKGENCLEYIVLSGQTIKYVNDSNTPRNISNIPSQTTIRYR